MPGARDARGPTAHSCAVGRAAHARGRDGIKDDPSQGKQSPYEKAVKALRDSVHDARTIRHNPSLLWLRLQQVVADLEERTHQIEGLIFRNLQLEAQLAAMLDEHQPPPHVVDAMRSHGRALRPIRVAVHGRDLVIGVQPTGRTDPPAENRAWRLVREQGGTAQ